MNRFIDFKKYLNKSYWNRETITEAIAFIIFVIQLLFIIYINLFCCRSWIDHDASMTYSHTIEMWKQKKLVLPGYAEETFLHLDTACIPAVLFYGLTKDIFISYGLSNVLFLAVYLFVIFDITGKISSKRVYSYIAATLFLIPYRLGMLEYSTMLFYEVSFYNFCVIAPLMAIDLFLFDKDDLKNHKIKYYLLFSFYLIFLAISAFSRGTYLMFVGIAPIIFCYFLDIILSDDYKTELKDGKVILVISTFIVYFGAMLYGKLIGAAPNTTGYNLVKSGEIIDNFLDVVWGYLNIFLDPFMSPNVVSANGIKTLILLAFALFTVIVIIFNTKHMFSEENKEKARSLRYLTIILYWNILILGLTQCNISELAYPERYLFPGFVPILVSVPIILDYYEKIKKPTFKNALYFVTFCLIICTIIVCNLGMFAGFKENLKSTTGMKEVIQFSRDNNINTIIYLNDDNASLISRSLAPDKKTVSVDVREDGSYYLCNREFYICSRDRGYFDDNNVLAVPWNMQPGDYLNEYMLSSYVPAADVENYHLYIAGSNKFDDKVGFPVKDNVLDKWIDFPYSNGYTYNGEINLYGYLETEGNNDFSLISPLLEAPYCACDISVNYEMGLKSRGEEVIKPDGHVVGQIVVMDDSYNIVASNDLLDTDTKAGVRYNDMNNCFIGVKINNGEKCTLHDLHFSVVK